jgi:hypothetical protein
MALWYPDAKLWPICPIWAARGVSPAPESVSQEPNLRHKFHKHGGHSSFTLVAAIRPKMGPRLPETSTSISSKGLGFHYVSEKHQT